MTQDAPTLKHFELHLNAKNSQQTAIELLQEHTSLSKQKLKSVMTNGAVWLESSIGIHRLRRAKKILNETDTLHLYYDENIQQSTPLPAELIADEGEYSIWNKPYGMYSQGSKWGDHCTINRWAEAQLKPQRPAFIVHRLDRAASGLILLAHSKKMAATFAELFKNREIEKIYSAVVEGSLNELSLPYTITSTIDNKPAVSTIISVEDNLNHTDNSDINTSKIMIGIETGRKHQIRKHLSELGHPIIGDRLYGSKQYDLGQHDSEQHDSEQEIENLQLQAKVLKFICPITKQPRTYTL